MIQYTYGNQNSLSASKLWVICDHGAYCPFSADLDNIYTDEAEAKAEAERMSKMTFGSSPATVKYWVQDLYDAVQDLKRDAESKGASDEREYSSRDN